MPSKKKKYNARFPAGRIKKIMQTDEEVGKVAQAVPVIISRTLELFVESLLTKSAQITQARSAKTLTPSHMKQCILSESRFDFLKDLVKNIPDASTLEDSEYSMPLDLTPPLEPFAIPPPIYEELEYKPQFYVEQGTSSKETTVSEAPSEPAKIDFSIASLVQKDPQPPQIHHIDLTNIVVRQPPTDIPPLIPLARFGHQSTNDNLCIDEDYDN